MDHTGPAVVGTHFQIEELVTHGGMGEIWRGRDRRNGQPVAIKRVPQDSIRSNAQFKERLVIESEAIAKLDHPHIVKHIASGIEGDDPYLVIEWLDGHPLDHLRGKKDLPIRILIDIIVDVLEGLEACHQAEIVHRDIKPGNIFLSYRNDEIDVKLIDFGLALMADREMRLTETGDIMGTLYYLSPEQARGKQYTTYATDIYSIGAVLYEFLTGQPPFQAEKPIAVLLKIVTETPPRPRQLKPEIPQWLDDVVMRALSREPEDRFESAAAMAEALNSSFFSSSMPQIIAESVASTIPINKQIGEFRLAALVYIQMLDRNDYSDIRATADKLIQNAQGQAHPLRGGHHIGIFGFEETLGDEAISAVEVGLSIARQHKNIRVLVASVHIFIDQGIQLNTDELDRATSLLAQVPSGQLMLDGSTRKLLRDQIDVKVRHGKELVVGLRALDDGERTVLGIKTPTVGRDTELTTIKSKFAAVQRQKKAETLVLSGSTGMGKSRLCRVFRQELGRRVSIIFEARCEPTKLSTPYSIINSCINRLSKRRHPHLKQSKIEVLKSIVSEFIHDPEQAEEIILYLAEALGLSYSENSGTIRWSESLVKRLSVLRVARSDARLMRSHIAEALIRLLRAAAIQRPVVIICEDLQWADDESLKLLEYMRHDLSDTPIFFLATCRSQAKPLLQSVLAKRKTVVELAPLSQDALSRLLKAVLGQIEEKHLMRMINWSDGNPYFIEELVSWLVASHHMVFGRKGWELADPKRRLQLPVGIEGAIQGRLDQLNARQKDLLKIASVFGQQFWKEGLIALGVENVEEKLFALHQLELIHPQNSSRIPETQQWHFRHSLLRQVAYQLLPPNRRAELHNLAGTWLERIGENDAALLSFHYERGGDRIKAGNYKARIAKRALKDGELETAISHFRESLDDKTELEPNIYFQRLLGLIRAYLLRGDSDHATKVLDELEALDIEHDDEANAEVLYLKGRLLLVHSNYQIAEELLRQSASIFDELGLEKKSFEVKHTLFWSIWVQGRYTEAGPLAEELHRNASAERPEDLCSAKLSSAYYNIVSGDLSAAIVLAEQAASHAKEIRHPYRQVDTLITLGSAQELTGLYDSALNSFTHAKTIIDRLDTAHHQINLNISLARLYFCKNQWERADHHYQRAIENADNLGDKRSLSIALSGRARSLLRIYKERSEQAILENAQTEAERSLLISEHNSPPEEADAKLALSEVLLSKNKFDDAVNAALSAAQIVEKLGTHEQSEIEILLAAYHALNEAEKAIPEEANQKYKSDAKMYYLGRAWLAYERRLKAISSPKIARSYAENIPHHRELQRLWNTLNH